MRAFTLLVCLALCSGCAARQGGSFCGQGLQAEQETVMASDAVSRLLEVYPPGLTTLHLVPAERGSFGEALEQGLRARGFRLEPAASAGVLVLSYTLDAIREEPAAWYLHMALSDGFAFSRVYILGERTAPEAGLAQTGAPAAPATVEAPVQP